MKLFSRQWGRNNLKLNHYYAKKISETTGIWIQSQYWGANRQLSMEGIYIEYFPKIVNLGRKEAKSEYHKFISGDNEKYACNSHGHTVHPWKKFIELVLFVSFLYAVWEDTNGCTHKYRSDFAIFLMALLSSLYGMIR